jgi:hypothetical protein
VIGGAARDDPGRGGGLSGAGARHAAGGK